MKKFVGSFSLLRLLIAISIVAITSGFQKLSAQVYWTEAPHVNGTYPAPFRYVGKIYALWPDGWAESTGFLVGENRVMTAAHAVYRPGVGVPTVLTFTPGAFGNNAPFGSANATKYWIPRAWLENWPDSEKAMFDVATFQISQNLGHRTRGWFNLKDFNTEEFRGPIAGYGPSFLNPNRVRVTSAGPFRARSYDDGNLRDKLDSRRYTWFAAGGAQGGRSGSPLFINNNGRYDVYGVYTRGDDGNPQYIYGVKITRQLRTALGF